MRVINGYSWIQAILAYQQAQKDLRLSAGNQ
jgi:hypothetical protein